MNARPIHRFISFLIDMLVTGVISFLSAYPAVLALIETLNSRTPTNILNLFYTSMISAALVTILVIAYYLVLPLVWKRQTIGRFLTRIAIVKDDGAPVDFKTLFVREVIGRMLTGLMSFGIALLADGVLITQPRHISFSDALARTKVIDI